MYIFLLAFLCVINSQEPNIIRFCNGFIRLDIHVRSLKSVTMSAFIEKPRGTDSTEILCVNRKNVNSYLPDSNNCRVVVLHSDENVGLSSVKLTISTSDVFVS